MGKSIRDLVGEKKKVTNPKRVSHQEVVKKALEEVNKS